MLDGKKSAKMSIGQICHRDTETQRRTNTKKGETTEKFDGMKPAMGETAEMFNGMKAAKGETAEKFDGMKPAKGETAKIFAEMESGIVGAAEMILFGFSKKDYQPPNTFD